MYDELKERCRACSQGCIYPSECSYFDKPPLRCMRQLLSEAADAIEELSRDLDGMNEANIALYGALPKWISVLDEDPPVGKRVLVTYNFSGSLHIETDKLLANGSWLSLGNVTHWMPLPKGPEEET